MKEYYRPKEAIKILGITAPSYRYLLTTNYFKSIKKIKNASWVSKKEINEYKNFLVDLNKNYISVEEIAKKLGMRKKLILKRLKKFSGNKIKHKNTYWIKKEFISREFEEISLMTLKKYSIKKHLKKIITTQTKQLNYLV